MGEIVVGVDGSEASQRALAWATEEAKLRDATLVVVTAWEVPTGAMVATLEPAPIDLNLEEDAEEQAVTLLEDTYADPGVPVRKVAVEGHPAPALMHEAAGAELLVLGASGHGEVAGMLLGSVALHAVTHAPCPVVIVRQPPA